MASCNSKEKEQVYTAARDGNLMYLKVSPISKLQVPTRLPNELRKCVSKPWILHKNNQIFTEPWIFLSFFHSPLFILIRFSDVRRSIAIKNMCATSKLDTLLTWLFDNDY